MITLEVIRIILNICIFHTFSCTFEDFKKLVDSSMKEAKEFMNNYELFKVNDHKSIMLICVYDIDKMQSFMSTTEILK